MATDSVPRFIKDPRFLNLVRSVEVSLFVPCLVSSPFARTDTRFTLQEYTEALESGRVDPRENAGPAIGKDVVDAMELGPSKPSSTR